MAHEHSTPFPAGLIIAFFAIVAGAVWLIVKFIRRLLS